SASAAAASQGQGEDLVPLRTSPGVTPMYEEGLADLLPPSCVNRASSTSDTPAQRLIHRRNAHGIGYVRWQIAIWCSACRDVLYTEKVLGSSPRSPTEVCNELDRSLL